MQVTILLHRIFKPRIIPVRSGALGLGHQRLMVGEKVVIPSARSEKNVC
jgi:hypothetical protein